MPPVSQKVTECSPLSLREAVTDTFKKFHFVQTRLLNKHLYHFIIHFNEKKFVYLHTRFEKLKIDKSGGTAAHRRVDRTSPYTFLAILASHSPSSDTVPFKLCFQRMSFERSKFESCIARSTRLNLEVS